MTKRGELEFAGSYIKKSIQNCSVLLVGLQRNRTVGMGYVLTSGKRTYFSGIVMEVRVLEKSKQ